MRKRRRRSHLLCADQNVKTPLIRAGMEGRYVSRTADPDPSPRDERKSLGEKRKKKGSSCLTSTLQGVEEFRSETRTTAEKVKRSVVQKKRNGLAGGRRGKRRHRRRGKGEQAT